MTLLDGIARALGGSQDPRLPQRVRATITALQDRSERLIGWIQLAVVLTFGGLYALSPKTFMAEDVPFQPVPVALSVYLVLTLVRIFWAHKARIPGWALAVSILFDMGLLMLLIWSFHLQYDQPASFYLKAPTLLYVFIFIALRALRFEGLYVALAGLVGALGWVCLMVYAVSIDPADPMITRDYVAYLTSNAVLLGAEFDKVISILMVTAILVLALGRARGLLVKAVAEEAEKRELSRFFAPEVAERIAQSEARIRAGEGEAREAAILMVDIRGFTPLGAHMPPSALIGLLAEYQRRVVPCIEAHGGIIDKFLGDGIMATFGAAMQSERFAAEALVATEALLDAADAWNAERAAAGEPGLRICAAVAHGRVVFGAVGHDESRLEYTVIGDPVNLAAKLEKANKALDTRAVTTRACFDAARRQGYVPASAVDDLGAQEVGGAEAPVDMVVLRR